MSNMRDFLKGIGSDLFPTSDSIMEKFKKFTRHKKQIRDCQPFASDWWFVSDDMRKVLGQFDD